MPADVVGYTVDTLQYGWLENPVDIDKDLEVAQFTLVHYVQHDCSQNYTAGARSLTSDNKKVELMPTRRAKAYSTFCSQTVSLAPTISSLLEMIAKINKTPYSVSSGSFIVIDVDTTKKFVLVLVVIGSVPIVLLVRSRHMALYKCVLVD